MPDEGAYVRGGSGASVDGRWLVVVLLGSGLLLLTALLISSGIEAVRDHSRQNSLRGRGVPVEATVTHCLGLASGTGITEYSFICRGTFRLGGHQRDEVIRGSSALRQPGDKVLALVVPGDPASLTAAGTVARRGPEWGPLVAEAAVTVLGLVILVLLVLRLRRSPREHAK